MKIKEGYILNTIGKETMAVPLGVSDGKFGGMVKLNEVAAFLWEQMQEETDETQLLKAVLEQYDVSEEKAKQDIQKFVKTLAENGILGK